MNKISIVVTTFNDSKEIIKLIDSIYTNQTYKADELIVSDGGSKDNTVELVENYKNNTNYNIKIISDGVRRNISEGINVGIKEAVNDWVLIVGTGNVFPSTYVENLVNEISKTSDKIIYGSFLGLEQGFFSHIFNQYFLDGNKDNPRYAGNHGNLIHKSIFEKYGYFWEKFIYAGEDTEFYFRMIRNGEPLHFVPNNPLYWVTPINYKEYSKKMKVNSIADWQIFNKKNIILKDLFYFFSLIILIILFLIDIRFIVLLLLAYIFVGFIKKTINILSITLGIFTKYLMIYYHL